MKKIGLCVAAICVTAIAVLSVPASPAAGGPAAKVGIRNFAYHPSVLRIEKGTRVVFVNRDGAAHDAIRRGSFDTGLLGPGDAAAVRFGRRGSYPYVCSLHPGMRGKVVVR